MDGWLDWMRERRGALLALALAGVTGLWWWQSRPVSQPAGVLASEDPIQSSPAEAKPWTFRNHTITPLAAFELRARVLGTERYRFDRAAELSPVDFALGWGPMSDSRVLEGITIQQRDRWYFWSTPQLTIGADAVGTHSANMHMIPATDGIRDRLLAVKTGQIIRLEGQLVRVDGKDGWHWMSSLSRADTGDGSCEVIWVEAIRVADR